MTKLCPRARAFRQARFAEEIKVVRQWEADVGSTCFRPSKRRSQRFPTRYSHAGWKFYTVAANYNVEVDNTISRRQGAVIEDLARARCLSMLARSSTPEGRACSTCPPWHTSSELPQHQPCHVVLQQLWIH